MTRAIFFLLCATAAIVNSLPDDKNIAAKPIIASPFKFASAAVTALSNAATVITSAISSSDSKLIRSSTRRLAETSYLRHAASLRALADMPMEEMVPTLTPSSQPTYLLLATGEDDDELPAKPTAEPTIEPTMPPDVVDVPTNPDDDNEEDDDERMSKVEGPTPAPTPSPSMENMPTEVLTPDDVTLSPTFVPTELEGVETVDPVLEAPTLAPTESPTPEGPTPSPTSVPTVEMVVISLPNDATPAPTEMPTTSDGQPDLSDPSDGDDDNVSDPPEPRPEPGPEPEPEPEPVPSDDDEVVVTDPVQVDPIEDEPGSSDP